MIEPTTALHVHRTADGWSYVETDAGESGWIPTVALGASGTPAPRIRSYRTELIAFDLVGSVVTLGIGYPFISPIVHLAEGNPRAAAWSFGLRVGLPLLGAVLGGGIGSAVQPGGEGYGGFGGAVVGFVIGGVTAISIDCAVLGEKKETPALTWVPSVTTADHHTMISFGRQF